MALELPDGFDEAPQEVQVDVLMNRTSEDLVEGIGRFVQSDRTQTSPQLNKEEKARILLALRNL